MDGRTLLLTGVAATVASQAGANTGETIKVLKSPTCGCCTGWVEHMRQAGFEVDVRDVDQDELWALKDRLQITSDLSGCHTATIGDYFVEGHVPASDVERLLAERPVGRGLTVPGMPMSAPGMGGPGSGDSYDTLLVGLDGATSVFASHS